MKGNLLALGISAALLTPSAFAWEYVVTDAQEGMDLPEWSISSQELGIDTPHPFKVTKRTLHGGKQEGVSLIEIDNGVMSITLIPTRGMDPLKVKSGDVTLGWDSPVKEVVNPAFIELESRNGLGWLDGFNEMMVRCGYEWTGHPGEDNGYLLSLHGRAGNTPASKVVVIIDEAPPYTIHVKGSIYEKTFKFNNYETWTSLSTEPGSKTFSIHDELTNLGDYENEYQIIYHGNFGRPLLEEGAKIIAPIKEISPFNEYAKKGLKDFSTYLGPTKDYDEMVYNLVTYADSNGDTLAMLHNKAGDRGVAVGFNVKQLPVLTVWKNTDTEKQGYVTGIEPGTSYAYNRRYQRDLGLVPKIQPGETKSFDLSYTILDSAEAVKDTGKQISDIQGSQKTKVIDEPLVDLSK